MRQINLLLIPAAAFMIVLPTPIVRLVFERGHFNAEVDPPRLDRAVLVRLQPALRRLNLLLTRTFFAVQRPWIPTRLAAMNIVVDIIVSDRPVQAARHRRADHRHVAANIVMTALQFHRLRIGFNGRLEGAQTTMITVRILLASALLAGVSWVVWRAARRRCSVRRCPRRSSASAPRLAGCSCTCARCSRCASPRPTR
jgi:putative peptidoglycan lipid II flippase